MLKTMATSALRRVLVPASRSCSSSEFFVRGLSVGNASSSRGFGFGLSFRARFSTSSSGGGRGVRPPLTEEERAAVFDFSVALAKFAAILYVMNNYVFEVTMCVGPSMLPTLNVLGDILIVGKLSLLTGGLAVGDVVISKSPAEKSHTVCKRIKGFGGDRVRVSRRHGNDIARTICVPDGCVWLEGDNPRNSTDSRTYGPVPMKLIRGKVLLRVWPPSSFGAIPTLADSNNHA